MTKSESYAIGIDLGGTTIKFGVVDTKGTIKKKFALDTHAADGPKMVIKQIKKGISEILSSKKYKICGIGIGSPGIVSPKKGTVVNPPNFADWGTVHLGKQISKKFELDTFVENDANAAAVGEMIFGAGKKLNSFIMVTLGTGVGGGIIVDRKLFHGDRSGAGEIGHITIKYDGPECKCGAFGCLEAYAGNSYIIRRVKEQLEENKDSKIHELLAESNEELTPKTIYDAAQLDDAFALKAIKELGEYIGYGLASACNLMDISNFIIGGGVAGFGEPLFNAIEETMKARVMKANAPYIKLKPARLKNDAGIKGASALVFAKS